MSSLFLGLVYALPLLSGAFAAPAEQRDVLTPRAGIAIKLAPGTFSSSTSARALSGAEVVSDLIRKAHPASKSNKKRDVDFSVSPLFGGIPAEKIAEMVQQATALDPTYEPVDFGAWFQVRFAETATSTPNSEIAELLRNLAGYEEVSSSQHLAGSPLPTIRPNDDPLFKNQTYLLGNGVGINAQYAWGFPGGDGTGTKFIDVERGWQLTHEDLIAKNITLLSGQNIKDRYFGNYPHGTAVLGELFMVDNTIGGVGIVPAADAHVVGTYQDPSIMEENEPQAIMSATTFLKFGDVMLLEMQTVDNFSNLYPVEILDAQYDAIRLATAMGITVIEPAANGGLDLDAPFLRPDETTYHSYLNRSSAEFRDSGAIMVGAGISALPRARLDRSNYGSRVDVHGWGENIATTGVDESYNDIYVDFTGTSGASPFVAGASLSVQGMVQHNRGKKLAPADLRKLLAAHGTASANPATDRIGVMPDLRKIIDGGYLK